MEIIDSIVFQLSHNSALLITYTLLIGLFVGSFLNVVIHRLPIMLEREWQAQCAELNAGENTEADEANAKPERFNLILPRSRCPHCNTLIAAWQNIPVISYLLLRGRCNHCGTKISLQYPLVELLTGLLSVWVVLHFGASSAAIATLALTWALIALSGIDLHTGYLPDNIILPFLWLGLILNINGLFVTLHDAVIGAAAGYLILWSVYWLYKLIMRKEGMGHGDFKLLAMLGAWFGWQSLASIILLSSVIGTIIGLGLIVFAGHKREIPIPFGPYLAIAGWTYMVFKEPLLRLWAV